MKMSSALGRSKQEEKRKLKSLWLILALLLVAVISTATVLSDQLAARATEDHNAIALTPLKSDGETLTSKNPSDGGLPNNADGMTIGQTAYNTNSKKEEGSAAWKSKTNLEIFKISYENGKGHMTAAGEDEVKLIAPGTEGEYTFKLKNIEDFPMDYTVKVEAKIEPSSSSIPLVTRIKSYDGNYLIGGTDQWNTLDHAKGAEGQDLLNANHYSYYTVEWKWPFESGDDAYDTMLGNIALQDTITMSITIKTTASRHLDQQTTNNGSAKTSESGSQKKGGIPQTGGGFKLVFFTALAVCALVVMILLITRKRRENKEAGNGDGPQA